MINKKSFKIAGDLFYTIMATVVMNIVLQIIVYPTITHFYGDAVTGEILYFIGFIYIIPQALGTTLSNTRLVIRKNYDPSNGDFSRMIVLCSALSALACGLIALPESSSVTFPIFYGLFSILYLLRAYAQVEFRLTLKFKEYFLYYCIISIGYLVGLGLYAITNVWLLIFIMGEGLALLYTLLKGSIFKKEVRKLAPSVINKTITMIALSTLVRDCVIQFDKVILKQTINASVVTQYHVVSLIAKTMQMLIQPINTLIMSYLTVKDAVLSRKTLIKFTGIAFLLGGLFYGVCLVGTPIYIKLFYPSLFDEIMQYNYLVNGGLILGFLASLFMAVLLSQGKTKLHTAIECVWGAIYIATAYYFSSQSGIWGLAYVTLVMNIIKNCVALICLFVSTKTNCK